jgi:hypothetical protein
MLQSTINTLTIFVIALIIINIGGMCLYKHENLKPKDKNPIYLAFGFGSIGLGGVILLRLIEKTILPSFLLTEIKTLRQS